MSLLHTRPQRPFAHTLEPSFLWQELYRCEDFEAWKAGCEDYRDTERWRKVKAFGEQKLASYEAALAKWKTKHPDFELLHQDARELNLLRVTVEQVEDDIRSSQAAIDAQQKLLEHSKKRRAELLTDIQTRKARYTDFKHVEYLVCPHKLIED